MPYYRWGHAVNMAFRKITLVTSAVLGIGGVISLGAAVDERHTHQDVTRPEFITVCKNVTSLMVWREQQNLFSARENIQRQIWNLQDRWRGKEMPQSAIDDLRSLKQQKSDIDRELDEVIRKIKKEAGGATYKTR
ncbi:MAG: hypothetical protein JRJ31_16925 [Deltaproteobacteria bacterium]|nr:hypothetical protein [Deltaproteobacteria bacterium]